MTLPAAEALLTLVSETSWEASFATSKSNLFIAALLAGAVFAQTVLAAPPSNDDFADAITISGTSGSAAGSNVEATSEAGEPNFPERKC